MLRMFVAAKFFAGYVGYYVDDDGSQSEAFFNSTEYSEGFAVVHKSPSFFSNTFFRDEQGNLSEELAEAENFYNGFAIVKRLNEQSYRLRDLDGNYSADSHKFIKRVSGHPNIFEVSNDRDNPPKFRTISGKITDTLKQALYFSNEITIFELETFHFVDHKFVTEAKENEKAFFKNERKKAKSADEINRINKLEADTMKHIEVQAQKASQNQPH